MCMQKWNFPPPKFQSLLSSKSKTKTSWHQPKRATVRTAYSTIQLQNHAVTEYSKTMCNVFAWISLRVCRLEISITCAVRARAPANVSMSSFVFRNSYRTECMVPTAKWPACPFKTRIEMISFLVFYSERSTCCCGSHLGDYYYLFLFIFFSLEFHLYTLQHTKSTELYVNLSK